MTTALIDRNAMDKFTQDDPELLADLAVIFVRFLPSSLAKLHLANGDRNSEMLRETAHQLKGQLNYFFCESLVEQAKELEDCGKNCQFESVEARLDQLQAGIELLLQEINDITNLGLELERD